MLTLLAAGLLGALVSPAPAPLTSPAPAFGPPAICHPLKIGEARSLPWGDGAFEIDPTYDRSDLVADTCALLDASDDLLVHMETLRRATILTTGLATRYDPSPAQRRKSALALVDALAARLDDASRHTKPDSPTAKRARARLLFDLGYAQAALTQAGAGLKDDGAERLAEAAARLPDDPAAQLGVVLATCGHGQADRATWTHLDKLFELVQDRNDDWSRRVARNATAIVGPFLGAKDRDELAALARRKSA